MMKRATKISFLVLLSCLWTVGTCGCSSDPKHRPDSITIDDPAVSLPFEQGFKEITFGSNAAWTITSDQTWITLRPESGPAAAANKVTVTYEGNPGGERYAKLTVKAGAAKEDFTVTQAAYVPEEDLIEVIPAELLFDNDGAGEATGFTITRVNGSWCTALSEGASEWITLDPSSGEAGEDIAVSVKVGEHRASTSPRSATITLVCGTATKTVEVTQTGAAVTFSVEQMTFTPEGNLSQDLVITSVADFKVDYDAGWGRVTDASGVALKTSDVFAKNTPKTLRIKPYAHINDEPRVLTLTVTPEGMEPITYPITQSGEPFISPTLTFPAGHARWNFSAAKSSSIGYNLTLPGSAYARADYGSAATLSYVRAGHNEKISPVDIYLSSAAYLIARVAGEGDYWLFDVPVTSMPANNSIHITFNHYSQAGGPKYMCLEYLDQGEWHPAGELLTATESSDVKYTHRLVATDTRLAATITFKQAFENESIKIRFRVAGNINVNGNAISLSGTGQTRIPGASTGTSPLIQHLGAHIDQSQAKRVLFVGNSYTYYNMQPYLFKEIAWKEGKRADVVMAAQSAYTVKKHLTESGSKTAERLRNGNFDYALIQEGSPYPAIVTVPGDPLGEEVLENLGKLINWIKEESPNVKPIVYIHWGRKGGYTATNGEVENPEIYPFFQTYALMQEQLIIGCKQEMQHYGIGGSPVGVAWRKVVNERSDIELFNADGTHPSYEGTYLGACVAYLTIFDQPFGDNPTNCLVDPAIAAYLRSVAEWAVFGDGRAEWVD